MLNPLPELRRALFSLLKTPGFTATAVLILALGIGANAAIFSLVDRVLLKPLPYRDAGRLVAIWGNVPVRDRSDNPLSAPDFLDWQRETAQVEAMAAVTNAAKNLTGAMEPQMIPTGRVSWNFFQVLGVQPALGRAFLREEDRAEGPRVVILTHELWQRRFGGDPAMVGRSIRLDGQDTLVVGIMPKGFQFAHRIAGVQALVPFAFTRRELDQRGSHFLGAVGRLKPGATVRGAQEDFVAIAARLARAYPDTNKNFTARVVPLQAQVVVNARGTLMILLGAVGCVLLIACANLMNLMLARGARRQREMAIRAALGAGPVALVWSALAESVVLGLLGGAAGLLLARWTLAGLVAALGMNQPGLVGLPLEPSLIAFTFLLSLGASVLFGLVPALKLEGRDLAASLKEGKGTGSVSHPRLRGLLVATETALATALLIGAGLMLRSLQHLQSVAPGFRPEHVLTINVALPSYKYGAPGAAADFALQLQRRLAESPGVEAVAVTDSLPMGGSTSSSSYDVAGQQSPDGQEAILHLITPGYFRTLGIPLVKGRDFAQGEQDGVIINEAMARRHFPGADPLAGRLSFDQASEPFLPVVGVVGSVRHDGLAVEPRAEMYFPVNCRHVGSFNSPRYMVALRTTAAPATMEPMLKRVLRELDPDLPLGAVRDMETVLARDRQAAQSRSLLLGSFAGLALLLAGIGIYAVITFLTALRTREIGVRMALGAQLRDVLRLVVGQGLRMALAGIAAGVVLALVLGRYLDSVIVGVKSWDPATLAGVTAVLVLVGVLACLLPALRAAKVDPMVALRNE